MKMYRQGDVLLRKIATIPRSAKRQDRDGHGRIVLAYGEVTGHAHAITDPGVDVFVSSTGAMYLSVKEGASLRHEEHATITLPDGNYVRVIQREYSPEEIRNVAD